MALSTTWRISMWSNFSLRNAFSPVPHYLVPILRSAHEQLMMHINTEWENTGRLVREAEYADGLLFCRAMPCAHGAWRRGECVPAGRQTADHPIEREREKERGRESCTESCKGQVQYLKHISHLRRAAYCCGRVPMPQRDLKQQQQQDTTDSSNNKI